MMRIYRLIDPILDQAVYVGATRLSLEARLRAHLHSPTSHIVRGWLRRLESLGKVPRIELIEECSEEDAHEREKAHIQELARSTPAFCLNGLHVHREIDIGAWWGKRAAWVQPSHLEDETERRIRSAARDIQDAVNTIRDIGVEINDMEVRRIVDEILFVCFSPERMEIDIPSWIDARIQEADAATIEQLFSDCGVESMKASA